MLDVNTIRQEFPALNRQINGRPIVYLDSAATYLKPRAVIDAVADCYREMAGTVGRGVHVMAEEAFSLFAEARQTVADFINAEVDEVVFVRNATEAINLVAQSLPLAQAVLGSVGEHHSNFLPWRRHASFHWMGLRSDGQIDIDAVEHQMKEVRPCLTTFSTTGNAFGTIHPASKLTALAHAGGSSVLLDASQSIAHSDIDVKALACDYLCFSGHKFGAPTGIGVLYVRRDHIQKIRPVNFGGGMVESVSEAGEMLAEFPMCLEAGTPAFEAVVGLAAACDFWNDTGMKNVRAHEQQLTCELIDALEKIPCVVVRKSGNVDTQGPIVAFHIEGLEAHGAARMLSNRANICVRSGFHCAQPAHDYLGWRPTIRASLAAYNSSADVQLLAESVAQITANMP